MQLVLAFAASASLVSTAAAHAGELDLSVGLQARIFVRSAGPNTTMPVGPIDPPIEDRDKLAEWLACGAP